MKKNYISPFTKVVESSSAELIVACSPVPPQKTYGFGNKLGVSKSSSFDPDEEGGITEIEGDWSTLSKKRGFYDCY